MKYRYLLISLFCFFCGCSYNQADEPIDPSTLPQAQIETTGFGGVYEVMLELNRQYRGDLDYVAVAPNKITKIMIDAKQGNTVRRLFTSYGPFQSDTRHQGRFNMKDIHAKFTGETIWVYFRVQDQFSTVRSDSFPVIGTSLEAYGDFEGVAEADVAFADSGSGSHFNARTRKLVTAAEAAENLADIDFILSRQGNRFVVDYPDYGVPQMSSTFHSSALGVSVEAYSQVLQNRRLAERVIVGPGNFTVYGFNPLAQRHFIISVQGVDPGPVPVMRFSYFVVNR